MQDGKMRVIEEERVCACECTFMCVWVCVYVAFESMSMCVCERVVRRRWRYRIMGCIGFNLGSLIVNEIQHWSNCHSGPNDKQAPMSCRKIEAYII